MKCKFAVAVFVVVIFPIIVGAYIVYHRGESSEPAWAKAHITTTVNYHVSPDGSLDPRNDERMTIYRSSTKIGTVLEIQSFGKEVSDAVLSAKVRVQYTNGLSFVDQAYLVKSEGIQVGDRVAVQDFMQSGSRGDSHSMIATKLDWSSYHGF